MAIPPGQVDLETATGNSGAVTQQGPEFVRDVAAGGASTCVLLPVAPSTATLIVRSRASATGVRCAVEAAAEARNTLVLPENDPGRPRQGKGALDQAGQSEPATASLGAQAGQRQQS
jgi:hypothetical protein